jgi:hypothetical protein
VVESPLHGVIDFFGCRLWRRLCGVLLNFSFRLKEYGAIFHTVVGFTMMEHAVRRYECVRASAVTTAMIPCAASLVVVGESLIEGPWISSYGGVLNFFSQFSDGPQPSESMLCTSLG